MQVQLCKVVLFVVTLCCVVAPHPSITTRRQSTHLTDDVDSTHENLVQMSVQHEIRVIYHRVLKASPYLAPQLHLPQF